jgi:hypothetical protein
METNQVIIYYITVAGKPAKTAEKVREVLETMYTDQPAGLCRNEDVGRCPRGMCFPHLVFIRLSRQADIIISVAPL